MVLQHLRDVNLNLNPNKCMFYAKNIKFLGHVAGKTKTRPNPKKIKVVKEFLVPKTFTKINHY
jgi:hypothetical protein